ncbi:hypothetical protein E3J79_00665 [Candidatus Dependentiae bacterium]|nr:MAG: hypothetical protein E3J79_00665 [Candidatus Dependentiae bacterium]
MRKSRFSVFNTAIYGVSTVLDNIRLFVLASLVKVAIFVVFSLLFSIIASEFIRALWKIGPQFRFFFQCLREYWLLAPYEKAVQCIAIWNTQIWPPILMLVAKYFIILLIFLAILLFVGIGIYLGFIRLVLTLHDTGKSSVNLLFSCFGLVQKGFLAGIIYFFIVAIGLILLVVPGIYFGLRLIFFPYFIVDKNAGIIDSLRRSFKITEDHGWPLFGLLLLIPVISQLPGMLGLFFGTSFVATVLSYTYRKLAA